MKSIEGGKVWFMKGSFNKEAHGLLIPSWCQLCMAEWDGDQWLQISALDNANCTWWWCQMIWIISLFAFGEQIATFSCFIRRIKVSDRKEDYWLKCLQKTTSWFLTLFLCQTETVYFYTGFHVELDLFIFILVYQVQWYLDPGGFFFMPPGNISLVLWHFTMSISHTMKYWTHTLEVIFACKFLCPKSKSLFFASVKINAGNSF